MNIFDAQGPLAAADKSHSVITLTIPAGARLHFRLTPASEMNGFIVPHIRKARQQTFPLLLASGRAQRQKLALDMVNVGCLHGKSRGRCPPLLLAVACPRFVEKRSPSFHAEMFGMNPTSVTTVAHTL